MDLIKVNRSQSLTTGLGNARVLVIVEIVSIL